MSILTRFAGWLRDGWLIVGVTLVFLVGLEGVYRGQAALRRALRWTTPTVDANPAHPYAGQPWYALWESREGAVSEPDRYDPYRGWWPQSYRFRYLNVDSAGRRVTPQSASSSGHPRRIFMLGGSTMWGYTARDSATIPTLLAQKLHALGLGDVEVVNFAQSGFTLTQEAITLLLELRAGNVPEVVVFLDGNNEVATAFQAGSPGHILNEDLFRQRFELTRRSLWEDVLGLGRHSALVERLGRVAAGSTPVRVPPRGLDPEAVCDDIAFYYRNLVRSIEALGREFGFQTLFLWQPLRATTGKTVTPWERSFPHRDEYRRLLRQCTAAVDSVMADQIRRNYIPLHPLFDDDTSSVFLDDFGHVTEAANTKIADRIAASIVPLLAPEP